MEGLGNLRYGKGVLHLVYANRTEALVEAFARDLEVHRTRPGAHPLDPLCLLVPHRSVEGYLRLELSHRLGITPPIETHLLRRFVARSVESSTGDAPTRLVDPFTSLGHLVALLGQPTVLSAPELSPVRHYVEGRFSQGGIDPRRRVALAVTLHRLFEEYTYSRPEMLRHWPQGLVYEGTAFEATERWQRALWLRIHGPDGLLRKGSDSVRWLTVLEAMDPVSGPPLSVPDRIYFFGFSTVAQAFHHYLARVASVTELHVYTLNPCMEFWEDLPTARRLDASSLTAADSRREERGARKEPGQGHEDDPFGLVSASDPACLRLWGKPGRENIRLLNSLSEGDFREAFVDPLTTGSHLLAHLQHDILVRQAEGTEARAQGLSFDARDESLRVVACPNPRREAESVVAHIWHLLRESEKPQGSPAEGAPSQAPLRAHDVAIVLPPGLRETYLPHLRAAFAEAFDLPYVVLDDPFASEKRLRDGADLLLGLPESKFTREDVLRVVLHPTVLAGFPEADRATWEPLPEVLGIALGADFEDFQGTYIRHDLFHWDQGLRRWAMGQWMVGPAGGETRPFEHGGHRYLPADHPSTAPESEAAFIALVRSLLADARHAQKAEWPLATWSRFLIHLLQTYLTPTSAREERELDRLVEGLSRLGTLPLGDEPLGYPMVRALVGHLLESSGEEGTSYSREGVAIGSYLALRALPFRVLFLMGMGEGHFPSGDAENPLDLRRVKRQTGDVSARDQDRYLFLEALLSAREKVIFSYGDRDAITGDALAPSSLLADLRTIVAEGYGSSEASPLPLERVPLRRFESETSEESTPSPFAFTNVSLSAQREREALELRTSMEEALGGPVFDPLAQAQRLAPEARKTVEERLGLIPLPAPSEDASAPDEISVSLNQLKRFLECSLQGLAAFRLGLESRDDDGDPAAVTDEPLETERGKATDLLRRVFVETSGSPQGFDHHYHQQREALTLSGRTPVGLFGESEGNRHQEVLRQWKTGLEQHLKSSLPPWAILRFGRADEHEAVENLREAIVVPLHLAQDGTPTLERPPYRARIHGRTQPLSLDFRWSLSLVTKDDSVGKPWKAPGFLSCWLDHVALSALGLGSQEDREALFVNAKGTVRSAFFSPLAQGEATTYLSNLVHDLAFGGDEGLLPWEAVVSVHLGNYGTYTEAVGALVENATRRSESPSFRCQYGPLPHPESYPPPPEARAQALVERRYGLLFERVTVPNGEKSQ